MTTEILYLKVAVPKYVESELLLNWEILSFKVKKRANLNLIYKQLEKTVICYIIAFIKCSNLIWPYFQIFTDFFLTTRN